VLEPGAGFAVETNRVTIVVPGAAPEPWPLMSKRAVADRLLDRIVAMLSAGAPGSRDPANVAASPSAREVPE
jgi:phosphopantothenoylcysteine decarboxylase / phosphopantothenate---cysteine ligase